MDVKAAMDPGAPKVYEEFPISTGYRTASTNAP
jgi:hypothetical protein